jgi:hypothetical protein
MEESEDDDSDFVDEVTKDEIAGSPSDSADPPSLIERKLPEDLRLKYEFFSYRSAATILAESHPDEFEEICQVLRAFSIDTAMIRKAGGSKSDIPKLFESHLHPKGWSETIVQGDLKVRLTARTWDGTTKAGKAKFKKSTRDITRERYLNGHKVDFVKKRVAFDLEWNSKDQTFDRDLFAFSAFAQTGVVDVGVLVTRSASLDPLLRSLGQALTKTGKPEFKPNGDPRMTHEKYGASTTWMGKLLYRLNAGRNGACPVLAIGITPACVKDWPPKST